uniref:Uncharacterized protein n=1 Tax=Oryza brachyantha TaxID=4533 RepID=J3LKV6_ORYBR
MFTLHPLLPTNLVTNTLAACPSASHPLLHCLQFTISSGHNKIRACTSFQQNIKILI